MPGLFDDSSGQPPGGILQGLGNYFNNIATNIGGPEAVYRQKAYQALTQQNGPQDAAILMGNPQAYGLGFQRQLFLKQLGDLIGPDPDHPKMPLSEALYKISPEGLKQNYGVNFGPPVEAGPVKAPIVYGQGQGPHLFNIGGTPSSPQQQQQTQQPVGGNSSALSNLSTLANELTRQQEAAKALGTAQGTAQGGIYNTQALIDKGLEDIDSLVKDPQLKNAVGLRGAILTEIPGTPAQGPAARLAQLHGESSLIGLQYLQKIGRLNINEFNAGANAISRLQQHQSYSDVLEALGDLKKVFQAARSRSGETAGIGPTPAPGMQTQPSQQAARTGSFNQDDLLAEARRRGLIK